MAKRLASEDQISIDGSNEIFGGYIFNASVDFSFSEGPTRVQISVVSDDGIYDINSTILESSLLSPSVITIGNQIIIDPVFLYEYEISKDGSSNILNLTYVDGSILLDKIFIGLTNSHSNISFGPITKSLSATLNCQPCPGSNQSRQVEVNNGVVRKDGNVYGPITRDVNETALIQNTISRWGGGFLIVGDERFVENECQIPQVTYNFAKLLAVLRNAGIVIDGLFDLNTDYVRDYHGTLREVLNNWCSDFGFSFYWNSFKKINIPDNTDIVGIDLRNPIVDISAIKTAFESINKTDKTVVTSLNEKFSLDNTKKIYHVSSFKKESQTKATNFTLYRQVLAENIGIDKLNLDQSYLHGRTEAEFLKSCALAKYDENLRDIYNWTLVRGDLGTTQASTSQNLTKPESLTWQGKGNQITIDETSELVTPGRVKPSVFGLTLYSRFKPTNINGVVSRFWEGTANGYFYGLGTVFRKTLEDRLDYNRESGRFLDDKTLFNDGQLVPNGNNFFAQNPIFSNTNYAKIPVYSETYIASQNQTLASKILQYEKSIADRFLGKYYRFPNFFINERTCQHSYSYKQDSSTVPNSEVSTVSSGKRDLPFEELIASVGNYENIYEYKAGNYGQLSLGAGGSYNTHIFQRNAAWGTEQESIDQITQRQDTLFKNKSETSNRKITEKYDLDVNPVSKDAVSKILGGSTNGGGGETFYQDRSENPTQRGRDATFLAFDKIDKNKDGIPCLVNVYAPNILDAFVSFSSLRTVNNKKEKWSSSSQSANEPSECELVCDRRLIEEICECSVDAFGQKLSSDGLPIPPYEGLKTRRAYSFSVTVKDTGSLAYDFYANRGRYLTNQQIVFNDLTGSMPSNSLSRSVTFPSFADYYAYYKLDYEFQDTTRKVNTVLGDIGNAGGLASIEVVHGEISDKIKTLYDNDNNEIVNVAYPVGNNFNFDTLTNYHLNRVQNLPQSVEFAYQGLDVNLVGLDFGKYSNYLTPKNGLNSLNINFDENGANINVSFSNRPRQLPEKDVMSYHITPRLYNSISNIFQA